MTTGLNAFSEKSFNFFQQHIGPGSKPAQNLQDGVLSREQYDKLKQSFVDEGLASPDDLKLEEKFNLYLADALDGTLDQQSVPGLLEALGQLGAHSGEASAVQFAQPKSFATTSDIPRLGKMGAPSPSGNPSYEFRANVSFGAAQAKAVVAAAGEPAAVTSPPADAPAQSLSPELEPYRAAFQKAGLLEAGGKNPLGASANEVFQKLGPPERALVLNCLRAGKLEQAYGVLAVNGLKQTPGASASPGMQGYMNALPNLSHTGPVTIEVNNPEQVHGACKVFSSSQVKPPVDLGVGENQNFNYYSYCDVRNMQRTGPVFQATVVHNPGPEPVRIKVRGSGQCNHEPSLEARAQQIQAEIDKLKRSAGDDAKAKLDALIKLDILGPDGKIRKDPIKGSDGISRVTGDLTRNADYLLTMEQILGIDMLTDDYPKGQDYIEIPAGQSMAVYTKIPVGSNTMRSAYQFEVISPEGGQKLAVDVVVTENKSTGNPPKPLFPESGLSTCGMLPASKDIHAALVENLPMVNAGKELMQGDDYNDLLYGENPRIRPRDEDHDGQITTSDMKLNNLRINKELMVLEPKIIAKTQQLEKTAPGTTRHADLQRELNLLLADKKKLLDQLFKLGRINGIKEASQIRSTIPPIDVSKGGVNLTYAINTKVIERAGTDQDQSMKMIGVSQFPNGPANLDDIAHGNYNAEYVISTRLDNTGDKDQPLYLAIGSPDAGGTYDNGTPQKPSYDPNKTDNPPSRSRFTGVAEIQIAGVSQPILAKVVNGHVELPKEIDALSIKAKSSLYITVRLIIPTNSTGPQSLQFSSSPP